MIQGLTSGNQSLLNYLEANLTNPANENPILVDSGTQSGRLLDHRDGAVAERGVRRAAAEPCGSTATTPAHYPPSATVSF
jgi:hypothetical protein